MSFDVAFTTDAQWFTGEHKVLQFTVYQPGSSQDQITGGTATPQNITGWTLKFTLETTIGAIQFTKVSGTGITLTDPVNGVCQVVVDRADTLALAGTTYHIVLERTDTGNESILARGPALLQTP